VNDLIYVAGPPKCLTVGLWILEPNQEESGQTTQLSSLCHPPHSIHQMARCEIQTHQELWSPCAPV